MTTEELRIACALKAGWRRATETEIYNAGLRYTGRVPEFWVYRGELHNVPPDYPHDLQACASLRASLSEEERDAFCFYLEEELNPTWAPWSAMESRWHFANATALQICRAFIATKTANPETV